MTFQELAIYVQKLESTPSRNTMTEILADLFTHASMSEIGEICYLLQGRVAPLYEAIEFGVADRLMIRAIAASYKVQESHVTTLFKKHGDLGRAAEVIANQHIKSHTHISVHEVFLKLKAIAEFEGVGSQEKKIQTLSELLSSSDALAVRFLVRIPLDKLRLGFSDMTILDALSWMLKGNKSLRDSLEAAYNVRPDLGYIASQVKKHGISGVLHVQARVGAPILAALCQRLPNAEEMIKKMGAVDVEPKYDGVRTQIHFERKKDKIVISSYSRNLENTTAMYPELDRMESQIDAESVILDSEAIGFDETNNRIIPFQETVTRKRKHNIIVASQSVPLRFFVFDILLKNGINLMSTPFSKRRAILEETIKTGPILTVSPHIVTNDISTLRVYHKEQIQKGLEGVVVKKWESVYEPGRRGFTWVKFKEEGKIGKLADTIDAVVMGFYKGEGKRTSFGIGAFLVGVKKGNMFVTMTKIGTGVSDELWKAMKTSFGNQSSKEKPKEYGDVDKMFTPDVWVNPSIVVEIAADDITKSPTHGAKFALRFPRLVRIRTDKNANQVTTVKELEVMYHNQESIQS
ncbi:MAG: ATP-dependent DNA ligase [Candidatus Gottesmanbacteria bacterium]